MKLQSLVGTGLIAVCALAQTQPQPDIVLKSTTRLVQVSVIVDRHGQPVGDLKKEDFKISLDKNVLSVSTEKKTENVEEGKKYSKREYTYNSFVRSFTLPESADQSKIAAEYTDGILKLNVTKKEEAKFQTREIAVK